MPKNAVQSPPPRSACIACAKAKRRCTKNLPACRRCSQRGLNCRYPPLKLTIELPDDFKDMPALASTGILAAVETPPPSQDLWGFNDLVNNMNTCFHPPVWFLLPESWAIVHQPAPYQQSESLSGGLLDSTERILSWLQQWVNDCSCPFIHAHLYKDDLPSCIQNAFTATAAYFAKTAANKGLILRIIEGNCNALLDQLEDGLDAGEDTATSGTFHYLARTQTLLIYQIIRLFDGDIRSRAQAENSMDLLLSWAGQLWESASKDAELAIYEKASLTSSITADRCGGISDPNAFRVDGSVPALWRAWYAAESIRRTYVAIIFVQGMYQTLKQGWACCPGGVSFTVTNGLWDSPSAHTWWELFIQDTAPPAQSLQLERLLLENQPAEVDAFVQPLLVASYGHERVDQWITQQA
ncbi:hypothetical protein TGAM01_v204045 [Trichoderma gamsii]|uniref:Zn(2)-C6 fungal-type domain-containing protein n=1 Tax=Trichoderma gamsii TaxID=398673 RepID=A0A2P4ZS44_9HYPO|nr:hypothetical protein TGAM01_v204045 [Trichoderma gamsii]PON27096.1 hypothetical protein TGAM01_v204045 [Trichoderma gamsii]